MSFEHSVHAGNGLHQAVPAHRLVNVHGVKARRVEARQPHVPHQHDFQRVARVAEPLGQALAAGLIPDVGLPVQGVRGRTGHHHLDAALGIILVEPVGAQAHQFLVKADADTAAHAHDHRLAFQDIQPLLEVVNDILCNLLHPLLRSDDGLQLRPFRLELLLALHLLALGDLLEINVDARLLMLIQGQFGPGGSPSRWALSPRHLPNAGCRRC